MEEGRPSCCRRRSRAVNGEAGEFRVSIRGCPAARPLRAVPPHRPAAGLGERMCRRAPRRRWRAEPYASSGGGGGKWRGCCCLSTSTLAARTPAPPNLQQFYPCEAPAGKGPGARRNTSRAAAAGAGAVAASFHPQFSSGVCSACMQLLRGAVSSRRDIRRVLVESASAGFIVRTCGAVEGRRCFEDAVVPPGIMPGPKANLLRQLEGRETGLTRRLRPEGESPIL